MRKRICLLAAALCLAGILCGCGETKTVEPQLITPSYPTEVGTEAGDPALSGIWMVDGIVSNGKTYSVHINEAIEDIYDNTSLTFMEDGTYVYFNGYYTEGTYSLLESGSPTKFLLKEECSYRRTYQDGEMTEIESTGTNDLMLASLSDNGLLCYGKFDPVTGGLMAGEDPLYFSENGEQIIPVESTGETQKQQSTAKSDSSGSTASNSYERILKKYKKKMEEAAPGLVREFKSEASGIRDLTELAELSNEKVGELAAICNDGLSEMASLMYDRNDSYSTYESWATKLQDEYTDIAMDIQDAYMDAAMDCF